MRTDEAMAVEDLHATLRAKIESDAKVIAALREALSWIEDHEPELVATARQKFLNEQTVEKGRTDV